MKKYRCLLFFQKNANVSIFVVFYILSRKNAWLTQFFFVDSNGPRKHLLFPRGPKLGHKNLYLVGTVLKACQNVKLTRFSFDVSQKFEGFSRIKIVPEPVRQ